MRQDHRVILIGQAPGPKTDPEQPLYPYNHQSSGARLADLIGVSHGCYLRIFKRLNLLQEFPGKTRRDDSWRPREAKAAAKALEHFFETRTVIFVGRNVAEAFGYPASVLEFFEWNYNSRRAYRFSAIPHTSGRNRYYNDPANVAKAGQFWARFKREYDQLCS